MALLQFAAEVLPASKWVQHGNLFYQAATWLQGSEGADISWDNLVLLFPPKSVTLESVLSWGQACRPELLHGCCELPVATALRGWACWTRRTWERQQQLSSLRQPG